jgi:hypothetical protein
MIQQKEIVFSALNAIDQILLMKNVIERHKKELLSDMIYKITESNGKHSTGYVSAGVYKVKLAGSKSNIGLEHDHVFTRKGIIQQLFKNPKRSQEILKKAIACTVTKGEHKKLSRIKNIEGWQRYKKAGLRVYCTISSSWLF